MHGIRLQNPGPTSARLEVQASTKTLESTGHPLIWSKSAVEQESLHIKPQVSQNARVSQSALTFHLLFQFPLQVSLEL